MREAIRLAEQAKREGNLPFGALVVKDGEIIATGYSMELTETDVTRHAELTAISRACKVLKNMDLGNCILYASGEPCNMCAAAIFQAGISKVIIGATRDDLPHFFRKRGINIFQLARDSKYQPELITGILRKEAIKLFDGVKSH